MRPFFPLFALAFALGAHAQPAKISRVGILQNGTVASNGYFTDAFVQGLADLGYVEGKNIAFEVRYAEAKLDRVPALARELERANIDVLFTPSAFASRAAKEAGVTVPIVFALTPDPVAEGFATSLARPGGNMTGLTSLSPEMGAKRIELLREAVPKLSRLAVLHALSYPGVHAQLSEAERAVRRLGKEARGFDVKRVEDIEPAFSAIGLARVDALLVIENPMFFQNRNLIIGLAEKYRLPAIYISREYAVSGGLMSYGSNYVDLVRRAASHVGRILKGASPGDLPIEQPIKFELVVNLRTAKALGLTIPSGLLLRADQVID